MLKLPKYVALIILLILYTNFVLSLSYAVEEEPERDNGAKTRKEYMKTFVENLKTETGFMRSKEKIETVESIYQGMILADFLQVKYDVYDLIYSIQSFQNGDYGFSTEKGGNSSIKATSLAVFGLTYLGVNPEDLVAWKVFEYLNKTVDPILYNSTYYERLTVADMSNIRHFILTTAILNITLNFPYNLLITTLKESQNVNGTYDSFYRAIEIIRLLELLGQKPEKPTDAINYIKAHRYNETGFDAFMRKNIRINDTHYAIHVLNLLDAEIEKKHNVVENIFDLQGASGGFKNEEEGQYDLSSTYFAYLIFKDVNLLSELDRLAFLASTGYLDNNTNVMIMIMCFTVISLLFGEKKKY